MFLRDFIGRCSTNFASDTAYIDSHGRCSWRDIDHRSDLLLSAMQGMGIGPGQRTAILSHNRIEVAEHWFACLKGGIVRAGLNWRYSTREMLHVIRDCDAKIIFIDTACLNSLVEHIDELSAEGRLFVGFGGTHDLAFDYESLIAGSHKTPEIPLLAEGDLAMIGYTSGTTGNPKGVLLSHKNIVTSAIFSSMINGYTKQDVRGYVTNPAGININAMCMNVISGMATVLENFDAERFLDMIEEHRVTTVTLVPTMLRRIVDDVKSGNWDVTSLRQVCYGTMPATPALIRDAYNTLECTFLNRYGVSESTGAVALLDDMEHQIALREEPDLLMSVGKSMPHAEIQIRDEDGNQVQPNELGTVWIRSDAVMQGYLNLPKETTDALHTPWLKTGDFGRMDERGYIFLGDRKHSMIVTGGFNVFPNAVESALAEHPAISEVAVVGIPHRDWGEAVTAAVTVSSDGKITQDELIAYCRDRLSKFEVPKYIAILDKLPRGNTDKVNKLEIRKFLENSPDLPWTI